MKWKERKLKIIFSAGISKPREAGPNPNTIPQGLENERLESYRENSVNIEWLLYHVLNLYEKVINMVLESIGAYRSSRKPGPVQ